MDNELKQFTVSVYTENNIGLLNRISAIFQRRHINIESINSSVSEIDGVSRWTILIYVTETQIRKIIGQIEKQVVQLSRKKYILEVLEKGTFCLLTKDLQEAVDLCNDFAPEHLSLVVKDEDTWLNKIRNSGAIYVGSLAAVAVGDFVAGPSHTLPTGGSGKSFSGLRADQFQRRASIVRMDQEAVQASLPTVETFARIEGLDAHGASVSIRVK